MLPRRRLLLLAAHEQGRFLPLREGREELPEPVLLVELQLPEQRRRQLIDLAPPAAALLVDLRFLPASVPVLAAPPEELLALWPVDSHPAPADRDATGVQPSNSQPPDLSCSSDLLIIHVFPSGGVS